MIIIRVNMLGLEYQLSSLPNSSTTRITTLKKSIEVNHPIEKISQAWYDWQVKGKFIQDAFHFLNADEREFLMTGITPTEWGIDWGTEMMTEHIPHFKSYHWQCKCGKWNWIGKKVCDKCNESRDNNGK